MAGNSPPVRTNSPIDKLENIRKILVEIEDLILMNYSINLS